MSLIKDIFDYLDNKMPEGKKTEFFAQINAYEENKKKFYDVLNFKTERRMHKACISKKELFERRSELYAKINASGDCLDADGNRINAGKIGTGEVKVPFVLGRAWKLSLCLVTAVLIAFSAIFISQYTQQLQQNEAMEYLASVEIQKENSDVSLVLSTGERIVISESKSQLDKSDIKIVADNKSVTVSNLLSGANAATEDGVLSKSKMLTENKASKQSSKQASKQSAEQKLNYLSVNTREDFLLSLEDGSRIWLRHNSKVGFPDKFSANNRVIEFEGEGYFDIASDSLRPFIIKTKDVQARVLGTEFNLKSSNSESSVEISMISGKLAVENDHCKDIVLTKDLHLVLEADSYKITETDNFKFRAWRDGYFFFENDRLDDIVKTLSYMYEIEIVLENGKYNDELFNGKMKRSNGLDKIIRALKESYNFKFRIDEGILYIY